MTAQLSAPLLARWHAPFLARLHAPFLACSLFYLHRWLDSLMTIFFLTMVGMPANYSTCTS